MPGLCLDRLQCHAGLAQPGEAGVTELVTGQLLDACTFSGPGDDFVQPSRTERLPAAWTLEHYEHVAGARRVGPLALGVGLVLRVPHPVVGEGDEEPLRDRDYALMSALAVGNEQAVLTRAHVLQAQPEDLAAT